ncbi:MAG: hypothetical protein MI861_00600, partial [Pirellulales bacterium]|nr:hypothetical protein [Pirellulales bacterium]
EPNSPSICHWHVADSVISFRQSPMLRRGVDPLLGDRRFTNWLVPGVAQPPVYTFMGLLALFVVLVGPVAYRRTTRLGRNYLMFAIAPLLAMVTTLAMFGYGVVADGFGTVARVRQLTWVDGLSGDAGERVRSTYFAGVRPGAGLSFPGDAEVMGYPEGQGNTLEELDELAPAILGKVSITDEKQVFDSSFLPSREQRQFVVHRPRRRIGVVSLAVKNGSGVPSISSTFAFPLNQVIARDAAGNYWTVSDLPAGGTSKCDPLPTNKASIALGRMYADYRPISAVRVARQQTGGANRVSDLIIAANRQVNLGGVEVRAGSFEQWLNDHLQLNGRLPERHFVATAEVSSDALAVEETELVESIRYVFGTMP